MHHTVENKKHHYTLTLYVSITTTGFFLTAFRSPPDNWEGEKFRKRQTNELIVCCSLSPVNMDYELEDLKTLAMYVGDNEDLEDMLLKYLEREE